MAKILRGEVRWADLNPTVGREQSGERPVLVLSHDIFNERSGTVIAMALTSQPQKAGFPLTLEIASVALPKPTWVKISQIRTLSVERLGKRMGRVSDDEMSQIVEGLNEIIGEQSAAGYRR
jgi:mRNA interferase MazF